METIKSYLENIFKTLPRTKEMLRLKEDLQSDMEAKYHELRQQGKSENEAIGTVITEFGNIDEIISEMGISLETNDNGSSRSSSAEAMPMETIRAYIETHKKANTIVGFGVMLILLGVSVMLALFNMDKFNYMFDTFPVVVLFMFIIPAVGLFIYSGMLNEKYKFVESGDFYIDSVTKDMLLAEMSVLSGKRTFATIISVSIILVAAVVIIILSSFPYPLLGASIGLVLIAIAVFNLVRSSGLFVAYQKLLRINDYAPGNIKANKLTGAVASVIFPVVTCVFLIWGFMFNGWEIAWILYPITGILFGAFSSAVNAIAKKE